MFSFVASKIRPLTPLGQCLICLDDYEPEHDIRVMSCRHAFHKDCVDKWLQVGRNNCPACRSKVSEVEYLSINLSHALFKGVSTSNDSASVPPPPSPLS